MTSQEKWDTAFQVADINNSGFIEPTELHKVFEKLNVKLDEPSTRNIVLKFDKDKDGKLSRQEFEGLVTFVLDEKNKAINAQKKQVKAPTKKIAAPSIRARLGKITGSLKEKTHQSVQTVDGLFVDTSFPANDSALTKLHRGKGVIWKRPSEIHPSPEIFVAGTEEGDVKQGHIGNCWFIGALAVVAASGSDLVEELFVRTKLEEGRHHIRFYKDFDWVVVEIDDLLPCSPDGRLLFAKCPDPREFWVPLVEKAYAKLHGGYHQIESGTITDALKDMTGEGVEVIDLRKLEDPEALWPVLVHNAKESFLMGCAIEAAGAPERVTAEGLLTNHAYSVLDCLEYNGNKLLQIRNPWGQGEWKGAWSDHAKQWTPAAKKALPYVDENDGTFFMNFQDFSTRFNIIHVLRLLTDDVGEVWQKTTFHSEWRGATAGGCTDHPTWTQNPQFSVTSHQANNKVFVCLSQPDQRYNDDSDKIDYPPIGAIVLSGKDDKYKKTTLKKEEVILRPHYAPRRDLSFEFTANPDIIIPTTFAPGKELKFELAIYTQKSSTIIERKGTLPSLTAHDRWEGKTAGGCPNFPNWKNNPQFNLFSDKTVKISLEQVTANKKDVEPLGIFVFPSQTRGERVVTYGKNPPVYNSPSFTPAALVQGEVTLEAGKVYVVLPCTFEANKEKAFHLSVGVDDPEVLKGITLRSI